MSEREDETEEALAAKRLLGKAGSRNSFGRDAKIVARALLSSSSRIAVLEEALRALADAVAEEADAAHSISGNMGARLSDARAALSNQGRL